MISHVYHGNGIYIYIYVYVCNAMAGARLHCTHAAKLGGDIDLPTRCM